MKTMVFHLGFQRQAFDPQLEVSHVQPTELVLEFRQGAKAFVRREFNLMLDKLLEGLDDQLL